MPVQNSSARLLRSTVSGVCMVGRPRLWAAARLHRGALDIGQDVAAGLHEEGRHQQRHARYPCASPPVSTATPPCHHPAAMPPATILKGNQRNLTALMTLKTNFSCGLQAQRLPAAMKMK